MSNHKVSSPNLGRRLRDIRRSKGIKSSQALAKLMGNKYNYSTISRRETGDLAIDFEYLNDFCAALSLSAQEIESLMASVRVNLLRPRSVLMESVSEWGRIVNNAKVCHSYMPHLVSRYMQTFDYAHAIVSMHESVVNPEEFARNRIENTNGLFEDKNRRFRILCHENALYYVVGSYKIMVEQLQTLLKFADEPNVEFRILPRETVAPILVQFGFNIVDKIYCHCENRLDVSITDDPSTVARFQSDFDTLWAAAVIGVRRNDVLHRAIKYYKGLPANAEE